MPKTPTPMVTASSGGEFFFVMIPEKGRVEGRAYVVDRQAFGVCYRVNSDGKFEEQWRTHGWYSLEVYLSDDGRHLVRMGPWSRGDRPARNHLAVAFYKDGKPIKGYSTAQLVRNHGAVIKSVSHYRWLARYRYMATGADPTDDAHLRLDWNNIFHLTTVDGIKYEFDARTGRIIGRSDDAGPNDPHRAPTLERKE